MAEFEAALAGDAFADACRIITSAGRSGMAGLLPDSKDPDLLVSLPRAIALAMREHPELQQTMREQFGDVGQIRVREAMTKADVEAVEAATVRFFGTQAAAEAFGWLGDRALAGGKFAQAAQAYQEALPLATGTLARDLQNRLRLAAGLLGHDVPAEEETGAVQIASATWTSRQFETLIEELRKTHARTETTGLADWNPSLVSKAPPLPPARYGAVARGAFAGDLGQGAGRSEDQSTDGVARQLAIAAEGDLMFVSNRFQVVCYQLTDGKTKWSKGLGGEQGECASMAVHSHAAAGGRRSDFRPPPHQARAGTGGARQRQGRCAVARPPGTPRRVRSGLRPKPPLGLGGHRASKRDAATGTDQLSSRYGRCALPAAAVDFER